MSNGAPPLEAIIDASVAAKWVLRDEAECEEADALLRRSAAGDALLYAPRQIEVEVAAAIRRAVLNQRLSPTDAEQALADWLGPLRARLNFAENADLLPDGLQRALQLGITLFDALYLVMAEQLGVELVTSDYRLLGSPAGALPAVRDLGTFGAL